LGLLPALQVSGQGVQWSAVGRGANSGTHEMHPGTGPHHVCTMFAVDRRSRFGCLPPSMRHTAPVDGIPTAGLPEVCNAQDGLGFWKERSVGALLGRLHFWKLRGMDNMRHKATVPFHPPSDQGSTRVADRSCSSCTRRHTMEAARPVCVLSLSGWPRHVPCLPRAISRRFNVAKHSLDAR
jgi:hypothetical protein